MSNIDNPPAIKGRRGFLPGRSGNPAGRPKGSKNAISLHKIALEGELRAQLKGSMQAILAKAIQMAEDGDTSMIKLLIDKTIPTSKSTDDSDAGKEKIQIVINKMPERDGSSGILIEGIKDVN